MIYGDPPVHVIDDQTDRIGIRTLILGQLWQPTAPADTIEELDAQKPNVPAVPAGVLLIGEQTRRVGGAMRTTWTFEGINGDGKSVTFKDRSNSYDYSFDAGFAQVSIVLHPKWALFKSKYGGYVIDGQVIFPDSIGTGAASGPIVDDNQTTANPLFGHEDFFRMEGTYTFRYASGPSGMQTAMQGIGFIADALPGFPPPVSDGRNWLKAPTKWQRRGPVLDISEIYWLSGAGGWPPEIYSKKLAQVDGSSGNSFGNDADFSAFFGATADTGSDGGGIPGVEPIPGVFL